MANDHDPSRILEEMPRLLPRLWRLAIVLSGRRDVADDLVQTTVRRAIERRGQFAEGTRLDAWMSTILVSVWKNEKRAAALRAHATLAEASELSAHAAEFDPETSLFRKQIIDEVGRLPEAQRETVLLVYIDGYTYAEAGRILEIPIGTVMSRLAAARTKLAERLGDADRAAAKAINHD